MLMTIGLARLSTIAGSVGIVAIGFHSSWLACAVCELHRRIWEGCGCGHDLGGHASGRRLGWTGAQLCPARLVQTRQQGELHEVEKLRPDLPQSGICTPPPLADRAARTVVSKVCIVACLKTSLCRPPGQPPN